MMASGVDKMNFNMGKLTIIYKGKSYEYLINTRVIDKQLDKTIEDILKWFPKDSTIDFKQIH